MTTEKSEPAPLPGTLPTTEEMVLANQANWAARTPVHVASAFYGLDGSRTAEDWFARFEWTDLGDLTGWEVLHLQCHLGTDTVSLARLGARMTGLDFSAAALEEARRLSDLTGTGVDFTKRFSLWTN